MPAHTRKPTPARRRDAADDEFPFEEGGAVDGAFLLLQADRETFPDSRSVGDSDHEIIGENVTFEWDADATFTLESNNALTLQLLGTGAGPGDVVDFRIDTPDLFDVDWDGENGNFIIDTDVVLDVEWTSGFDIFVTLDAGDDMTFELFTEGILNFRAVAQENLIMLLSSADPDAFELYMINLPTALPAEASRVWVSGDTLKITPP